MAAQQLAGAGFKEVINLKGGIKGWEGHEAVGREDQGMDLFEDLGSVEDILKTAYSLEDGLQDFYLRTMQKVTDAQVIKLFRKLADIEDIHKEKLFEEYTRLTGSSDLSAFEQSVAKNILEGGMTTEEYMERFTPDLEKTDEVISLAMSIEAQALDLYTRAGRSTDDQESKDMLERIGAEERYHLQQLGSLMDNFLEEANE